jgi:hypothetical protein
MNQPTSTAITASPALIFWNILQAIFWLIGLALLFIMIFNPPLGVTLFWNILIPVAPALFVFGTGIWRNVCPLGTTALLPDRLGLSKKKKLSNPQRITLNLAGIILLLLIIPLRHLLFNINGQATALIIFALSVNAIIAGFIFERKSGWCSGLCPIHPVERLYGSSPAVTLPNVHCNECVRCSVPCPDSTNNSSPAIYSKSKTGKAIEILLVGGFPGYVWGWFQVPDYPPSFAWRELAIAYGYPVAGAFVTIFLYFLLKDIFPHKKRSIQYLFAAAAVSCYYWFRLPMLFGFSTLETNGMLVNLRNNLPSWSMKALNIATTGFFLWWMVLRKNTKRAWLVRPEYTAG